jgi:hypothetical protein
LGGGNVQRELAQFGQGLAAQDLDAQFNRMGMVASTGLNAGLGQGQLAGQQAGIQGNLGQAAANIPFQTGNTIGNWRNQAGRDISVNEGNVSSALADLNNQLGSGYSDILGAYGNNFANLQLAAANGDAKAREDLASILANQAAGQSFQVTNLPQPQLTQPHLLNDIGRVAGAVGGISQGWGNNPQQDFRPDIDNNNNNNGQSTYNNGATPYQNRFDPFAGGY